MSYIGQAALKNSELKRFDVTSSTSATHVLSWTAPNEQSLWITINGVKQQDDAYTIAGVPTTVTLTDALVATDKMEVIGVLDIGVITIVGDNTVSTAKLGDTSVTTAKLGALAVTNAKMADDAVGVAELSATGTASATTYLRGDNAWSTVDTSPTGPSNEKIFFNNETQIDNSYSIPASTNSMSVGPVTLAPGVIVTVPTGSIWVVV
jgi:hypothetical protein